MAGQEARYVLHVLIVTAPASSKKHVQYVHMGGNICMYCTVHAWYVLSVGAVLTGVVTCCTDGSRDVLY